MDNRLFNINGKDKDLYEDEVLYIIDLERGWRVYIFWNYLQEEDTWKSTIFKIGITECCLEKMLKDLQ